LLPLVIGAVMILGASAHKTRADMLFTQSGTDDNAKSISSSALFHVDPTTDNLIVTVTNATPYTSGWTIDRTDLMTAFFFNITGTPGLTFLSAKLATGSSFIQGSPPPASTNLLVTSPLGSTFQDGWEYKSGAAVSSHVSTAFYGVGTTGLNVFDGSVVQSPHNNADYAMAPASYPGGHANNSDLNQMVLAVNSIVFTFSGLGPTFDETTISNARFQFGTDLSESSLSAPTGSHVLPFFAPSVPEPSTLAIAGFGALGLLGYGVRRRLAS
jgi:hypothetical protein